MGDSLRGKNYVFPFLVFKNEKGEWDVHANNRRSENMESSKKSFADLWKRIIRGRCD
jgi:hypothetical protein